jgi:Ca2+-transporting ATPase
MAAPLALDRTRAKLASARRREPGQASWHGKDVTAVETELDSDRETGLTHAEAAARLARHGPNQLERQRRTGSLRLIGRQFGHVLVLILLVAAAISLAIGEITDAITILVIVVINAVLGFIQEYRAEQAIEALRRLLAPHAVVVRQGESTTVAASDVVPGDLLVVDTGGHVAADVRLVDQAALHIDEASLTGESVPVAKSTEPVSAPTPLAERTCMGWSGTTVVAGHGRGLVVSTGASTELGRIAEMTRGVEREETPLQRSLSELGWKLGLIAVGVSVVLALVGLAAGKPAEEMFLTAISLAVAVIPEGLPAVVTITLALGIRSMVRRQALLRRLPAAETLGAASVICTDKTGTITENRMVVQELWTPAMTAQVRGGGYRPEGAIERAGEPITGDERALLQESARTGLLCNRAALVRDGELWAARGAPTEAALVALAGKLGLDLSERPAPRFERPFDSARKMMTVVIDGPDGAIAHVKGAPEVILARASRLLDERGERAMTDDDRVRATRAYEDMAARGMRTLALARRQAPEVAKLDDSQLEADLVLLGIAGIVDPPRPEVPGAIALAHRAGIRVLMITGDAAPTAAAIARQVGLDASRVITGVELEQMSDEELREALGGEVVFARTAPEHKLRIIEQLQALGKVTAMTGDGVNDAPALRRAEIGVAMGQRGTDVAKDAADMVLTDDNFASIVNAVEEGRRQYDNIKKFVHYMISSNTGEVMAILLNVITGAPLILLPVQILWINLVTDGLNALALGVEPLEPGAMARAPRSPSDPIASWRGLGTAALVGIYIGAATLWLFLDVFDGSAESVDRGRTIAFTGLVVFELANVFNFRSLHAPMPLRRVLGNRWLLAAIALMLSVQLAAIYAPFLQGPLHTAAMSAGEWTTIAVAALPLVFFPELFKRLHWRRGLAQPVR